MPITLWHYAGIQDDHYSKPSGLHDENGFAIDLMYLERDKRVVVSADFAHALNRHRRRDDDSCRATYSPGRTAQRHRRRRFAPRDRAWPRPVRALSQRGGRTPAQDQPRPVATTEQIVAASRGHIEQSANDDPHSGEESASLSQPLARLYLTGRVSTYSSGIMLERVELPLPIMLRLAGHHRRRPRSPPRSRAGAGRRRRQRLTTRPTGAITAPVGLFLLVNPHSIRIETKILS